MHQKLPGTVRRRIRIGKTSETPTPKTVCSFGHSFEDLIRVKGRRQGKEPGLCGIKGLAKKKPEPHLREGGGKFGRKNPKKKKINKEGRHKLIKAREQQNDGGGGERLDSIEHSLIFGFGRELGSFRKKKGKNTKRKWRGRFEKNDHS